MNNCVCNNAKCAFYYSFANDEAADNEEACISGRIKDGKCSGGLRSQYPGQPCTYDSDCAFVNEEGEIEGYGTCTCGYNAGSLFLWYKNLRSFFVLPIEHWGCRV